jgi:hypothetical protein
VLIGGVTYDFVQWSDRERKASRSWVVPARAGVLTAVFKKHVGPVG